MTSNHDPKLIELFSRSLGPSGSCSKVMAATSHAVRLFAVASYAGFLAAFAYFAALVLGYIEPRATGGVVAALAVDAALIAFFGVTHSLMARASFKQWSSRFVAAKAERSVYVLVASAQLALVVWQWRAVGGTPLWQAQGALATVLTVVQACGFGIALLSTFLIDHLELFGLAQAFGRSGAPLRFSTPSLYRVVRHPLYFGLLVALWCPPTMTVARFALAAGLTVYVLVGATLEERDLVRTFGDEYRAYQDRVPMLLPRRKVGGWPRKSASS